MGPVKLGAQFTGNQPSSSDGDPSNHNGESLHGFFPALEVHGARIWSQPNKLREGNFCLDGSSGSGIECFRAVAWQAKNEGAEHAHAVAPKGFQPFDELFSGRIKLLVNIFQT